ncbi:MAG: hypothetical protein Q9Q40_14510, partial [Acidobacteriota bacterium]|nr:hypothetical protein [Acidobacteriota bacterium]
MSNEEQLTVLRLMAHSAGDVAFRSDVNADMQSAMAELAAQASTYVDGQVGEAIRELAEETLAVINLNDGMNRDIINHALVEVRGRDEQVHARIGQLTQEMNAQFNDQGMAFMNAMQQRVQQTEIGVVQRLAKLQSNMQEQNVAMYARCNEMFESRMKQVNAGRDAAQFTRLVRMEQEHFANLANTEERVLGQATEIGDAVHSAAQASAGQLRNQQGKLHQRMRDIDTKVDAVVGDIDSITAQCRNYDVDMKDIRQRIEGVTADMRGLRNKFEDMSRSVALSASAKEVDNVRRELDGLAQRTHRAVTGFDGIVTRVATMEKDAHLHKDNADAAARLRKSIDRVEQEVKTALSQSRQESLAATTSASNAQQAATAATAAATAATSAATAATAAATAAS